MCLGFLLVTVEAFRCCCQLRGFRYQDGFEEVWIQFANGPSEPNIEEVGERGITNIVVVGRIGADQKSAGVVPCTGRIDLATVTAATCRLAEDLNTISDVVPTRDPRPNRIAKYVCFCEIPYHWNGLSTE